MKVYQVTQYQFQKTFSLVINNCCGKFDSCESNGGMIDGHVGSYSSLIPIVCFLDIVEWIWMMELEGKMPPENPRIL